ncbi:MAG: hypothetical protein H8D67_08805 [Deltaproteobacteria bacterium]|nr:hypothetical protein [Deltaproteobacteria bacterium]
MSECKEAREQKYRVIFHDLRRLGDTIDNLYILKDQLIEGDSPLHMSACNESHQEFKDPEKAQVEPAIESLTAFLNNAPDMVRHYIDRIDNCVGQLRDNLL